MGHQYSYECDCASCHGYMALEFCGSGHTEQDSLVPEEVELDEIPCSCQEKDIVLAW